VGRQCPFVGTAHRVVFQVEEDGEGRPGVSVTAWRLMAQPEDFDAGAVEPTFISRKVVGFDCRCAEEIPEGDEEIEWLDLWEDTNRIPAAVEVSLYLEPPEEGGEPVELKRIVTLPIMTQAR
jgi:hypothetical protein